ncbi:MAG: hypothetical protein Q8P56_05670, partial [Candidatus Uhrbacteria bacterium]|nr:hypothetical protein [Candidatus Uhrbacteria bacterium]
RADYELYRSCIDRAQQSFQHYIEDLLVTDMIQRCSLSPYLKELSSPRDLIDEFCTTKEEGVRFEARRALYLATHFFEYEKQFGNQELIKKRAFEIDLFLSGLLSRDPHGRNIRVYHKLTQSDDSGFQRARNIRVPFFDLTGHRRRQGENYIASSMYRIFAPSKDGRTAGDVIWLSRRKDPWSATLKAIRKNEPIRTMKDCIGVALYLYPHDENMFDALVNLLEQSLPIQQGDRFIHPARNSQLESSGEKSKESTSSFLMEKMVSLWQPRLLLEQSELVDGVLPFGNKKRREQFWDSAEKEQSDAVQFELQIGLFEDYINQHHAPTDQNHAFYKVKQASGESMRGDATGILELLLPIAIFGINFRDDDIREALLSKQRARFGHHHSALERKDPKETK